MQKKLIALAVAGMIAAPAAMAQSNVTIYGLVDMGYTYRSDNIASGVGSKSALDSGVQSGNRLGFRGTEDLGNGLKAGFVLEMGLFVDNGQSRSDGNFSRQSFLTLSGDFGTVAAGRQYSPQFNMLSALDPFGTGTVGQANNLYVHDTRLSNTIAYVSPSFSGLNVTVAHSTQADGINQENLANVGDARVWAIAPVYRNGPIMVGLNYHRIKAKSVSDSATKVWDLGGSYDFGVVKLSAMYGSRKDSDINLDRRQWFVGATAPVSEVGNVLLSYGQTKNKGVTGSPKATQWALGYTHNLSSRTNLYAAYADISNKSGAAFSVGDSSNSGQGYQQGFSVGVRHRF